jgi:hypothetical protein
MGAVAPIVGAGLSVVGGLAQAGQARAQANAQKKAIESQAQVEQLNSRLQLLNLNQQAALADVQSQLQSASEKQAYLGRLAAIDQQETYNSMALASAGLQARTQEQLAGAQQNQATVEALAAETGAKATIGRELVQALQNSGQEQSALVERMSKMDESQRRGFISSLLDLAASAGGTNEALKLLGESTSSSTAGQVARAEERQQLGASLAEQSAAALRASAEATRAGTQAQAALSSGDARFQAQQQLLDVQTSGRVADAAFASERTATEAAYSASGLSRGVEDAARAATTAASKEVLERGASLSQATAQAQLAGVRSPGFFDYVGILGGGASTYLSMGGSTSFLQRQPSSSAIRRGTDYTNALGNVG